MRKKATFLKTFFPFSFSFDYLKKKKKNESYILHLVGECKNNFDGSKNVQSYFRDNFVQYVV